MAEKPRPVRARAILAGLFFLPFVTFASTNQPISNIFSLIAGSIGALIIMVLVNQPLKKFAPKAAFSPLDLLVFYSIVAIAGNVAMEWLHVCHSSMHAFPLVQGGNPLVRDTLAPNMPGWLSISDVEKVRDLNGGSRDIFYVWNKLPVYWPVYMGWALVLLPVIIGLLCMNSLMRATWTQTERLTFPLIQLPVAMVQSGPGSMWRSKPMWIAFGIMFAIDMLNGINYLYPNVPSIPVKEFVNLELMFKEPPLSNIGYFPIALYPFMAAIGIFVPSDLLFSIVFFFLVRKATNVIMAANGIPQGWFSGTAIAPGPPYWDEQTWGAVLAMFVTAIWIARRHLKDVWRDIRTGSKAEDGGLPHRWAFVGLVICFCTLVGLGMWFTLPLPYMVAYVSLIFIFGSVISKLRAQLGPPLHEFAFFGPNSLMYRAFGTDWLSDRQAVFITAVMVPFNRIHRNHPGPIQLESMKMTRDKNIHQGQMFWTIAAVSALAVIMGFFFIHVLCYRTGAAYRWSEGEAYLRTLTNSRHGVDMQGLGMTAFGALVVICLDVLRFRFPGFPIHPGGYVLSMNFGVDYCWFGLLIALLVKNFVTRYYGLAGYDRLRMVAFGILLGEYGSELIWMTWALATGQSTYSISLNERGLGLQ